MSTPNFETMYNFDLYVHDDSEFTLRCCPKCNLWQDSKNVCINCGEPLVDAEAEWDYNVACDFYDRVNSELNKVNQNLQFYHIELQDGYYAHCQFIVKITKDAESAGFDDYPGYSDPDNWACNHYLGVCRSIAMRKHDAEVNRINKKILPALAKKWGFIKLNCVGIFSNGEAVYERAV